MFVVIGQDNLTVIVGELYSNIAHTLEVRPSRVEILWMMVDGEYTPLTVLRSLTEGGVDFTTGGRRLLQVRGSHMYDDQFSCLCC